MISPWFARRMRRNCCPNLVAGRTLIGGATRSRCVEATRRSKAARNWSRCQGLSAQNALPGLAVVVPNRFNVVAVWIVNESSVVAGPVVAVAGGTVVLSPRCQRRLIELRHLLTTTRFEGYVRGHDRSFLTDPEVGVLTIVESGSFAVFHVVAIAERRKRFQVEGFRFLEIADR